MREAIRQIIPNPLSLEIHCDDVAIAEEVFKCIAFFVTAASDPTADHAHPVVFERLAEGACSWPVKLNLFYGFTGGAEEASRFAELQEELGGNSS